MTRMPVGTVYASDGRSSLHSFNRRDGRISVFNTLLSGIKSWIVVRTFDPRGIYDFYIYRGFALFFLETLSFAGRSLNVSMVRIPQRTLRTQRSIRIRSCST